MIENHEELLKELSELTGMKLDEVLFKSEELLILPAFWVLDPVLSDTGSE